MRILGHQRSMNGADRCTANELVEVNEKTPPNEAVRAGPRESRGSPRGSRGEARIRPGRPRSLPHPWGPGGRLGFIDANKEGGADPSAWGSADPSAGLWRIPSRRPSRPCDGRNRGHSSERNKLHAKGQRWGWRKTPSSSDPQNPAIPGALGLHHGMAEILTIPPCLVARRRGKAGPQNQIGLGTTGLACNLFRSEE
jgi:hypothetical protein